MIEAVYKINQYLSNRIPGAKLDANNAIGIQQEDLSVISLEVEKSGGVCHLYAQIATPTESDIEPVLYAALEINQFSLPLRNCWLAIDPGTGTLTLCHNIYIPMSNNNIFDAGLDNFLDVFNETKMIFNEYRDQ